MRNHIYSSIAPELYKRDQIKYCLVPAMHYGKILILSFRKDLTHNLAFLIYSQDYQQFVIHYLYVKQNYKALGCASNLLRYANPQFKKEVSWVSHMTFEMRRLNLCERWNLIYNPYIQMDLYARYRLDIEGEISGK